MQQGMLFHTLHDPGSAIYFVQSICYFQGKVDVSALKLAWQRIIDRHAVLRTSFVWEGVDEPVQVVSRHVQLPLLEQDWQALSQIEQQEELQRFLSADRGQDFELSKAPLMRLVLIRLAGERYRFIWSFHHILLDGWSAGLLWKEISAYYQAFCEGEDLSLEPASPYRDYIAWLQDQDLATAKEFWQRRLQGFTAPSLLPVDRVATRTNAQLYTCDEQQVWLSSSTTAAIQLLAQQQRMTINTVLQGAWALLLSHYSGQVDVVFGVTISGRAAPLPKIETMVGLFINTLPVRVRISPGATILPWLKELQAQQVEMAQYEYTPLAEVQVWSDVPRRQALFESILVFENYPAQALSWGQNGSVEKRSSRSFDRTNYPITVEIGAGPELRLLITYDSSRFEAATIEGLLGHWQTLLTGIVTDPYQRLADLPLLTEPERRRMLETWNSTQVPYPTEQSVHRLFEAQVERRPEAIAVVFENHQLTYHQLNERANQLAYYLQVLGVGPEVAVGIFLEQSLDMVVALLGILKAGGSYVPLDRRWPKTRLGFILSDASIRVVLTRKGLVELLPEHEATLLCVDQAREIIESHNPGAAAACVGTTNAAYILYTSGSTGLPKGVVVSHQALVNHTLAIATAYQLTEADRVLQFASLSFDVAAEELYPSWSHGSSVILRSGEGMDSLPRFLRYVEQERVTVLNLPSSFWHELVKHLAQVRASLPSTLRAVVVGSEPVSVQCLTMWQQLAGSRVRLWNAYGLTETTITSTLHEASDECLTTVPIGRPIANVTTYVLDRRLRPVPVGMRGELYIGGMGLSRGYLNRPALTADRFIPDPFGAVPGGRLYRTGDQVQYLPNGNLQYLGRIDQQVKIRGFRVEPSEIEVALSRHPAVNDVAVVIRDAADGSGDKRLVAHVVTSQTEPPSSHELRHFLHQHLPTYMVPSSYVLMDALPVTPSGKIDRQLLAQFNGDGLLPSTSLLPPRTSFEQVLMEIWAHVLKIDEFGVNDNFFDLGGHSLSALRLISRVRTAFDVDIPLRSIFEAPTIAHLSQLIERLSTSPSEIFALPLQPVARGPHSPLSNDQYQLWSVNQKLRKSAFFNLTETVRLKGALNVEALVQALSEIARRHEAVRTTFPVVDGKPVQMPNAPCTFSLPVIEVHTLSESDCEAYIRQAATNEGHRPFDLTIETPLRATLLLLAPEDSILIITMHHIMWDDWSVDLLFRELGILYEAFAQGQASPLKDLPIQFADFASWQERWLTSSSKDPQLTYWNRKLAGLTKLHLEDLASPAERRFRYGRRAFRLSQSTTSVIKSTTRQEDSTLFMMLLATFELVLYRRTRSEDIAVATEFAGRNRLEIEELIGLFANTLVLRVDLSGNPTFRDVLQRVRRTALEAYSNQDLPYDFLVEAMWTDSLARQDVRAQVYFLFEDVPLRKLRLHDLTATRLAFAPETENAVLTTYELIVHAENASEGLSIVFLYNKDLFEEETIEQMIFQYKEILERMPVCLDRPIGALCAVRL